MRLSRRVWCPEVFEYCPALVAGVAVRRRSGVDCNIVGGSHCGGGMGGGGSESPEYDKTIIPTINTTQKKHHNSS